METQLKFEQEFVQSLSGKKDDPSVSKASLFKNRKRPAKNEGHEVKRMGLDNTAFDSTDMSRISKSTQ